MTVFFFLHTCVIREDTASQMKGTQLTEKHFIDLNSTKAKLVDNFIRVWQKLVYSLLQRNCLCKIRVWTSEQETCLNKPKWNNFLKYCEQKQVLLTSCINQHPRFLSSVLDTDGPSALEGLRWQALGHPLTPQLSGMLTKGQLHCSWLLF